MKITFMGAGSTVFARNVIGDCMCTEALRDSEFALYDIEASITSFVKSFGDIFSKTLIFFNLFCFS